MKSKPPPLRQIRTTVSAPASVGASKLRLEVATGNPRLRKENSKVIDNSNSLSGVFCFPFNSFC